MIRWVTCFSLCWQLQQHQPLHQQQLSLPRLRMILLLPPPIEEVLLPPLTFSSLAVTVSVGSDIHTFDCSFTCTTCPAKAFFFLFMKRLAVYFIFFKSRKFCKFTLIYIIQIYFSTLLHLILTLYNCDFAFPIS